MNVDENPQPIFLENNRWGNYWIFPEDKSIMLGNYLVPKADLNINEYNLKTIKLLFNITQENIIDYSKFTVVQAALVIPLNRNKWQLDKLGILNFDNTD